MPFKCKMIFNTYVICDLLKFKRYHQKKLEYFLKERINICFIMFFIDQIQDNPFSSTIEQVNRASVLKDIDDFGINLIHKYN